MFFFLIKSTLVLEQHVVFESYGTETGENGTAIKMIGIGSKTVNDVVI